MFRSIYPSRRGALCAASLLSIAALLAGCGAGGQSLSSPSLSPRPAGDIAGTGTSKEVNAVLPAHRLGLFVADYSPPSALADASTPARAAHSGTAVPAYAHVYVTVHKIELVTADDQTIPIWADDAGRVVDLMALKSDAGAQGGAGSRVALLGGVPVPGVVGKKAYKRVRVTLGKGITFLNGDETTGKATPIDDAVGRDDEGRPVMTVPLDKARDLGTGKDDLVVAFDRAAFTFADGHVLPAIREGGGDTTHQEPVTVTGVVSEGSSGGDGPDRVFVLTPDTGARGETMAVTLHSSAPVFRADGKPSPALIDGVKVAVRGTLDPKSKRLIAASVAVLPDDEKPGEVARIAGGVHKADDDASSLTVSTAETANLAPTRAEATVTLADDAVLRSASGLILPKAQFFAQAKRAGAQVETEGAYEPATGVLSARRARLLPAGREGEAREASVLAVPRIAGAKSLSLVAPLLEWDGIVSPASGKAWTVNVDGGTVCTDKEGKSIAFADVLTALQNNDQLAVHVVGAYAGGAITAGRLELRAAPPKSLPVAAGSASLGGRVAGASGAGGKNAAKLDAAMTDGAKTAPVKTVAAPVDVPVPAVPPASP